MEVLIVSDRTVHDGIGGKHAPGAIVDLPENVALALIGGGVAEAANVGDIETTKAKAKATKQKADAKAKKATAAKKMEAYDDLPKVVREMAQKHGDAVVEKFHAGETIEEIREDVEGDETAA